MTARIHPTARIEAGVAIGPGTHVWDHAHVRGPGTRIGAGGIIGEKTYIAYGVTIGDRVKLNSMVYICTGVTLEDGVLVGAGSVFTNDRFPRATTPDLATLRDSAPGPHTRTTRVREGATLGAGCVIGCDLEVGRFAMVGMGAVVTRTVRDFQLVVGNPARAVGCVCRCGEPILRFDDPAAASSDAVACAACGLRYALVAGAVKELSPPPAGGRR